MIWLLVALARAETVGQAFPPPEGAQRVVPDAFGAWLQALALHPPDRGVSTHDGRPVHHDGRVIVFPLVQGDLQQCADTAIRLRAEWLRETGGEIVFHATSGDPMPWTRWERGERPFESGGRLHWRAGTQGGWESYLQRVFQWAGTRSLAFDTVPATDPRPGDVVVDAGSPGHAVILLDVATRGSETWVLVGEGYMPAQDLHVEIGPERGWWPWRGGVDLPHWRLPAEGLRRW